MANAVYTKARQKFLEGGISWLTDTIKFVLVDGADYTPNTATHEFLSDVPAAARVAVSGALQNKTSTDSVADADNIVVSSVSGDQIEYVVVFKDTGVDSTSPLICIFDSVVGMPFTPTGGDVTVEIDPGATRLFKL